MRSPGPIRAAGRDVDPGQEEVVARDRRTEHRDAVRLEPVRQPVEHHRLVAVLEQQRFEDVPGGRLALDLAQAPRVGAKVVEHGRELR